MSSHPQPAANGDQSQIGDHPALNILNTVANINGERIDSLQSDDDVLHWLKRTGWPIDGELEKMRPSSLLQAARELRETIRSLIEKRKTGKRTDPSTLNAFLQQARSYLELVPVKDRSLQLERVWKQRTAAEILAPLAESAADLLAHGDFNLIKRCEDESCILWFYDRTKSHHRRWCSMATCGNRNKVAAYRKRLHHEA
jgi:predicted RNA-binding Zn ribbon-like protein